MNFFNISPWSYSIVLHEIIQYFSIILFKISLWTFFLILFNISLRTYLIFSVILFNIALLTYSIFLCDLITLWSYSILLNDLIQYFSLIVFNISQWSYSMFLCDHIQGFSMTFLKLSLILSKVFYNIYWSYFYFYIQEFCTMFISSPVLFENFSSFHGRLSWPKMVVITEVGTPTSAVSNKLLICESFIVFPRENHKK